MPSPMIPGMKIERVTPAKAEQWLVRNDPDNRSKSRPYVGRYSRHLTEADRLVLDSGQRRTLGHKLAIRRIADPNNVAATMNILLPWRGGTLTSRLEPPTEGEVYDFLDGHMDLVNIAIKVARTTYDNIGSRLPVCAAAYIQLALLLDDPLFHADLDMIAFFDTLMNGELIEPGAPVGALRRMLIKRTKALSNPLSRWEELAYYVKAINLWAAGKQAKSSLLLHRPITEATYRIVLPGQPEEEPAE